MESYEEFLNRINSIEKLDFPLQEEYFIPDQSTYNKVDANNEFRAFYGDTTVFDLDEESKKRISKMIKTLYSEAPECFCEKRITDTLHMTMHDLTSSNSKEEINEELDNNLIKIKEALKETPIIEQKIKMRTNFITDFGHVNLVLALCPINEEEDMKLMKIRSIIDKVKKLDYEFTPHVTLAYFNSKGFDVESVKKLVRIVRDLNKKENFEVILDTKNLYYQRFTDMNCYENVLKLAKE